MEVKIGVQSIPREIVIETNSSPEEVERSLTQAVAEGGLFILPDDKGGKILVPADKIGYQVHGLGAAPDRLRQPLTPVTQTREPVPSQPGPVPSSAHHARR